MHPHRGPRSLRHAIALALLALVGSSVSHAEPGAPTGGTSTEINPPGEVHATANDGTGIIRTSAELTNPEPSLLPLMGDSRRADARGWTVRSLPPVSAVGVDDEIIISVRVPTGEGSPYLEDGEAPLPYLIEERRTRGVVYLHWAIDGPSIGRAGNCILVRNYPDPFMPDCGVTSEGLVEFKMPFVTTAEAQPTTVSVMLGSVVSLDTRDPWIRAGGEVTFVGATRSATQ